jgi:hypothetical protein
VWNCDRKIEAVRFEYRRTTFRTDFQVGQFIRGAELITAAPEILKRVVLNWRRGVFWVLQLFDTSSRKESSKRVEGVKYSKLASFIVPQIKDKFRCASPLPRILKLIYIEENWEVEVR